jgi:hypothetical protein
MRSTFIFRPDSLIPRCGDPELALEPHGYRAATKPFELHDLAALV